MTGATLRVWLEREPKEGDDELADVRQAPESQADAEPTPRAKPKEPIRCRRCGNEVSEHSQLFLFDSERLHRVFANPHGYLHEIVTLRRAWNLRTVGAPTTEFSWYPGYAWTIVHCDRCAAHLGWMFEATTDREPARFWGLRRGDLEGAP